MAIRSPEQFTSDPFELSRSIVALVRRGKASTRNEVAEITGAGRSLVSQRVAELIDLGILLDDGRAPSRGGRAPRDLRFNSARALVIGAEIGVESTGIVITELDGSVVAETTLVASSFEGPEATLAALVEAVAELEQRLPPEHPRILGAGIGLPGPVDFHLGAMVSPPGQPRWDAFPVADHLEERLGVPVWVDNDANVAAIGEQLLGAAQEHENFIAVKVESGVGAAIVLEGALHRGTDGGAGDIGHVAYSESTVPCDCGKTGCLSTIAGGAGVARRAMEFTGDGAPVLERLRAAQDGRLSGEDVARAASMGDPVARQLIVDSGTEIGRVVALLVAFANPSLVVLTGGMSAVGDVLLGAVRSAAYRYAPALGSRHLEVQMSRLGPNAGATGAALLAVDQLLTTQTIALLAAQKADTEAVV